MTSSEQHDRPPADADQARVLDFLGKGMPDQPTKRIDTHASIVFLQPDRVFKIKRAVRLPFLDYSTLEKRKQACEDELAINKRYAPELYRRVVPFSEGARGIEIGGSGAAIEWAVEMARFDEQQTFDHLAAAGEIRPELADALADVMRAAHDGATIANGDDWPASISGIIDRNTEKFRGQTSLPQDAVGHHHEVSHRQVAQHLPLIRQRAAAGLVRRCHGDAHLGNVVLIDRKPVLFDAIEFDPVIATTDVLYDLAFPIMDLIHFGQRIAANRLFNHYLQATWRDNAAALRLLPLYLSMRAAIRAHVLFTKSEQSADTDTLAEAKSYFELALRLAIPSAPSLIAIGGRSGTGKSQLARGVASLVTPLPGAVLLRSDVIRKELSGVDALVPLPEAAYNAETSARVYRTIVERAGDILGEGVSAAADAAFLRESERQAIASVAHERDVTFRPIFLTANYEVRLKRIASRRNDASDATREVVMRQEHADIGELDWPTIDASGSPEQTLEQSVSVITTAP
jgi:uncharacterized protein